MWWFRKHVIMRKEHTRVFIMAASMSWRLLMAKLNKKRAQRRTTASNGEPRKGIFLKQRLCQKLLSYPFTCWAQLVHGTGKIAATNRIRKYVSLLLFFSSFLLYIPSCFMIPTQPIFCRHFLSAITRNMIKFPYCLRMEKKTSQVIRI